jgi:hypothetical protein
MKRIKYRGFCLDIRSQALRGNTGWIFQLDIEKHDGSGVIVWPIYLNAVFPTSDDAIGAAAVCARKAIDGGLVG